jgi:endonuclease/exonuclease/phosphatase family metal-dependent hydrolase
MKKFLIILLIILLILVGLPAGLFYWASGGTQNPGTANYSGIDYGSGPAEVPATTNKLTLLTWNLSWAYGFGSEGKGYVPKSATEMTDRLNKIGLAIKDSGADIVLLQEIDFDSSRSYHVDQLKELAKISGLRYGAKAVSWKAGYVPFPYWPISSQFGKMNSGGAVLSRYPIIADYVTLYPKPESNPWWYNAFYLFRYTQQAAIKFGEKTLTVMNNHLEAYDKATREMQAQELADNVKNFDTNLTLVGGDMNTVPPEAVLKTGFPDGTGDDYTDDSTLTILKDNSGLKEVIPVEDYKKDESAYFTFPSQMPNRRLDYLFVPNNVAIKNAGVLNVGDMSDHLPVRAELEFSQ